MWPTLSHIHGFLCTSTWVIQALSKTSSCHYHPETISTTFTVIYFSLLFLTFQIDIAILNKFYTCNFVLRVIANKIKHLFKLTKVLSTLVAKSAQIFAKTKYENIYQIDYIPKGKGLIIVFLATDCSCIDLDVQYQLLNEAYQQCTIISQEMVLLHTDICYWICWILIVLCVSSKAYYLPFNVHLVLSVMLQWSQADNGSLRCDKNALFHLDLVCISLAQVSIPLHLTKLVRKHSIKFI